MTTQEVAQITTTLVLLYVEDNPEVQAATLEVLHTLFDDVITASNGQAGLEAFETAKPDLIITDLNMPVMGGLGMIRKIRENEPDIPIIIISARNESHSFIESIELGVNGYALKPIDLKAFMLTLSKVVEAIHLKRILDRQTLLMQQYQEITDKSSIVSKTDAKGIINYVNEAFCRITGYSREELLGTSHNIISHPDTPPEFYKELWHKIMKEKQLFQGIIKNKNKVGKTYYSKTTIMPLLDEKLNVTGFMGLHDDVTEMMQPIHQLRDYLASCSFPVVVMIKIEGFDQLQQFFGEHMSESIEKKFVEVFGGRLRTIAPCGKIFAIGSGNVVLALDYELCEFSRDELEECLKAFQQEVDENHIELQKISYDFSVIISIADGSEAFDNAREGIRKLEQTYERFIYADDYRERLKAEAKDNLYRLQSLKNAIDSNRIISYFQPIIDNRSGKVVKYESLVRMIDNNGKVLSPAYFLDVAKRGKFYNKITLVVLKNSFEALKITDKEISINLSIQDMERKEMRDTIISMLEANPELTHRIVFELLEDERIDNVPVITSFIANVKSKGVKIAIDDFGSGYSNYQRLMQYQPDILKIDGSLIKSVHEDAYVHSVVTSIVDFANQNGIQTLAEFVENEMILECIKEIGIDFSQGYHFSAPHPIEDLS